MIISTVGQGTTSSQSTAPTVPFNKGVVNAARVVDQSKREEISQYVREYFTEAPILAEVARCESTFRQLGLNGKVLRGNVNPSDIGIMQINEEYHSEQADKLGYDLYTLEGNLAYAKYLYNKEGLKPWRTSAKCWNQPLN